MWNIIFTIIAEVLADDLQMLLINMKKFFLLCIALRFCVILSAQNHDLHFRLDPAFKLAPIDEFEWIEPGKSAVGQTEVTIDQYLAFIEHTTADSSNSYIEKIWMPDECVLHPYLTDHVPVEDVKNPKHSIYWIDEYKFQQEQNWPPKNKDKKIKEEWYNPYNKPITGITYEQVMEFAKWCTSYYNKMIYKKFGDVGKAVIFRLLTPEEFADIEKRGIEQSKEKDSITRTMNINYWKECKNAEGCALCNCKGKDTCEGNKLYSGVYGDEGLYSVWTFNPNWFGLYNMQGNAAEMTSKKGIAKGGSYLQTAKECLPEAVQHYDKPEKWLGFRLVAEVVQLDDKIYFNKKGELIY